MRAVTIGGFGPPEGLVVVDLPDPTPAAGQVVITTEAIGVGGVDALIRRGSLAAHGFAVGHVPGTEVAGTVTAIGTGVDPAWAGRRVWAPTGTGGGYAEQALVPAEVLVPLPPGLSPVDAVTLGGSGAVAHFALLRAGLSPGESVLVRGAAGGIGVVAVQLAARAGAVISVTTSSADRGDRLRALGATHILDRAGRGAPGSHDVVLDVVAGADLPTFLDALAPNGRMVVVGVMAGPPPADFGARLLASFRKSLSFATFSTDTVPTPDRRAATAALFTAARRGEVIAVVHEVLPLGQAVLAHRALDSGAVFGRIALVPQWR
ncbi:zinc-binding dehydrogenase [Actinosynnema sp. NPDC020468]|uniref:zinc-binding dehydrogenase n=1 Tax=Actinosynnema sp. NPDC020468 TaxID=3154488 RepID=UPI0033E5DFC1